MKFVNAALNAYRSSRKFTKTNRTYKAIKYSLTAIVCAYALVLIFPQFLFANETTHKNFKLYANQTLDKNAIAVLEAAEARLLKSPIYKKDSRQDVFVSGTYRFHLFMTLDSNAFGSTIPVIGHIRINKSDFEKNLVIRDSAPTNHRSLSGVIAHEVMHNQIREKLGIGSNFTLPKWKDEGYCEYIAGETTLSFDEGLRLWSENRDGPGLNYFKYHQMVRYLLDVEKISVDELFAKEFNEVELERKTLSHLKD